MKYVTAAGSTLEITGRFNGVANLWFDRIEEEACFDCRPDPYPDEYDGQKWLVWRCEECGGGRALLSPVDE